MAETKWRSVDTVRRDGDLLVLQQRVFVHETRDGDLYVEPGRNHRLRPAEKVV